MRINRVIGGCLGLGDEPAAAGAGVRGGVNAAACDGPSRLADHVGVVGERELNNLLRRGDATRDG
jgi:hypothetical protein